MSSSRKHLLPLLSHNSFGITFQTGYCSQEWLNNNTSTYQQSSGTCYQVPGTRYQVPGTSMLISKTDSSPDSTRFISSESPSTNVVESITTTRLNQRSVSSFQHTHLYRASFHEIMLPGTWQWYWYQYPSKVPGTNTTSSSGTTSYVVMDADNYKFQHTVTCKLASMYLLLVPQDVQYQTVYTGKA